MAWPTRTEKLIGGVFASFVMTAIFFVETGILASIIVGKTPGTAA